MNETEPTFDDGRGRYPDRISAPAPRGMKSRIKRAAQASGLTSSAFIRAAVEGRILAVQPEACTDGG